MLMHEKTCVIPIFNTTLVLSGQRCAGYLAIMKQQQDIKRGHSDIFQFKQANLHKCTCIVEIILEDLKVLWRSRDLLNNVKIDQGHYSL